jgi:hypothetical protein
MPGLVFIVIGAILMVGGTVMLIGWVSGKSNWFDAGVYDRQGSSKTDRQFLNLYFLALVIAPLLVGATLIVYGLRWYG